MPYIFLAVPNRTTVFKGEYALIELNRANVGDDISISELPENTSLVVGATDGSELRWVGPTTLIYRAGLKASGDNFGLERRGDLCKHFIKVDFTASQSNPGVQAQLKARFNAAPPTILTFGRGVGGPVAGPDPRIEGARTRAQELVDYLK